MTDSMIERVARIICPRGWAASSGPDWHNTQPLRDEATALARAVLTAMRDPTDDEFGVAIQMKDGVSWGEYRKFWRAMIDAVLEDGR